MDWLRIFMSRFAGLFSKRRLDAELDEELRSHIDMAVEEHRRRGLSEQEARTQALREFGGVTQTRERYRDQRGFPFLESLWRDIRYGQRQLRKSPGFTIAVVCTLALGIGANLAVFLVLYGVVLRPLPFPHPRRLVQMNETYHGRTLRAVTATEALFFRRECKVCEAMAAYTAPSNANLIRGHGATPLTVEHVTAGFFHVFEMEPVIGRGFQARDMVPNGPGTVVLSDATWRHDFGAKPDIVGRAVTIGSNIYTVVGVASPKFRLQWKADAWVPLPIVEHSGDHNHSYFAVARLKPGISMARANLDMKQVLREYRQAFPNTLGRDKGVRAVGLHEAIIGQLRRPLEMLMGAVLLVWIIVAANILGLLLTRTVARRQDMAVRMALGATAWRMLRTLLIENLLLCVAGGVAGVVAAWLLTPVLMQLSPLPLPAFASLGMGGSALAFAGALIVISVLTFSLVPALETRRSRLGGSLKLNATRVASGRHLAQRVLVVSQVAVSLMLLVAAAILLSTFWKLVNVSPGFNAKNVLTFRSSLTAQQEATTPLPAQRLNELAARIEALPGVESAAEAFSLPMEHRGVGLPFTVPGRAGTGTSQDADYVPITANYFHSLSIPVVAGRAFTLSDRGGSPPVVVVNEKFAKMYLKGQNPIGRHILIGAGMGPKFKDQPREIVGVVGNVRESALQSPAPPIMYLPTAQVPIRAMRFLNELSGSNAWVVRLKSAHVDVIPEIRQIFMRNAHAPLLSVESMSTVVSGSVASQRFSMILLCAFGLISLAMSGAGLYGVMSYNVARRKREIGIRMALGARRKDVAGAVLLDAGLLVGLGLTVGIVMSLGAGKLISSLLFGAKPQAPLALVVATVVMLLTGLFAAWWPALRAAGVDPMEALRNE